MKIKKSEARSSAGGFIPEGMYRARVIGTKFVTKNGSGQPMTTLDCEIIEPETLTIDGAEITVAGRKFPIYLIHNVERTGWASQEQVNRFCDKLRIETGLDENGEPEYDTDQHKEYFHGREFDIILKSEEEIKRYERKPGQKQGDPILDGEGNQISNGFRITGNADDVPENCHPSLNEEIARMPY